MFENTSRDIIFLLSTLAGQRVPLDEKTETTRIVINLTFIGLLLICLSFSAATLEKARIPKG